MATSKKKQAGKKPVKKSAKSAVKKAVKKSAPAKKSASVKTTTSKSTAAPAKLKLVKSKVRVGDFITPLDDRLIVGVDPAPEKTAGGLYIPGNAGERPGRGEVLAKGRGRRNKKGQLRPLDVEVGDQVLFAEFAGSKITIGSEEFLILREEEVLGIVT